MPELHPQYIVDESNQKHSVILPLAEYEALIETIVDMAAVIDRRDEPCISHQTLLSELTKGSLSHRHDFETFLQHRLKRPDGMAPVTLDDMQQAIAKGANDAGR